MLQGSNAGIGIRHLRTPDEHVEDVRLENRSQAQSSSVRSSKSFGSHVTRYKFSTTLGPKNDLEDNTLLMCVQTRYKTMVL